MTTETTQAKNPLVGFLIAALAALIFGFSVVTVHNHTVGQFEYESNIVDSHISLNEMLISVNNMNVALVARTHSEAEEASALVDQYIFQMLEARKLTVQATEELAQVQALIAELKAAGGLQFTLRREIRERLIALRASVIDEADILEKEMQVTLRQLKDTVQKL